MSQQSLLRSTWLKACLCMLAVADGGALIRPAVPLMGVLAAAAAAASAAMDPAAAVAATAAPRGGGGGPTFSAGSRDPCPSLPLVAAADGIGEAASASFAGAAAAAGALPLVVSVICTRSLRSPSPTQTKTPAGAGREKVKSEKIRVWKLHKNSGLEACKCRQTAPTNKYMEEPERLAPGGALATARPVESTTG